MTGMVLLVLWTAIGVALATTRRLDAEPTTARTAGGAGPGGFRHFVTIDQAHAGAVGAIESRETALATAFDTTRRGDGAA